jgi:sulfate adenylyltransferase subunit 1
MDLVSFSEDIYNNIVIEYSKVAAQLGLKDVTYIPISALNGDNIVEKSDKMLWYEGESLLAFLEKVEVEKDINYTDTRFPVQYVIRPQTDELHDYRGYAGKLISGVFAKGDEVIVQPSGLRSTVKTIEIGGEELDEAYAPQSVVLHLEDDIDVSRGDVIVRADNIPHVEQEVDVLVCWMANKPLNTGNRYFLQINSRVVKCVVKDIEYRLDVNSLEKDYNIKSAALNDIVKAKIKTASPIVFDEYTKLRVNGGAILIDETSLVTVGACMIQTLVPKAE